MRLTEANKLKTILTCTTIFIVIWYFSKDYTEFITRPSHGYFPLFRQFTEFSEPNQGVHSTFPITNELLQFVKDSEQRFATYRSKRDASIASRGFKTINPWTNPIFWDYFAPSISCPYPISRVGALGDGGKWICGLNEIAQKSQLFPCIIYSFGVGGDSSFEAEMLTSTNCSVFAFDPTVDRMNLNLDNYPGRVQFFKVGLGNSSTTSPTLPVKSLKEHMNDMDHVWVDVVKVDIEGPEFEAFEQAVHDFPDGLPFAHLNLELHLKDFKGNDDKDEVAKLEAKQFKDFWIWWEKLERVGLRAFSHEVNHLYNIVSKDPAPRCVEYSFINVKPFLERLNYTYNYRRKNIYW